MSSKKRTSGWKRAGQVGSGFLKGAGLALKAYRIASKVAALVNTEKKMYTDWYISTVLNTGTPILRLITDIPAGTGGGQRDGMEIALKSLHSRFNIDWNGSGTQIRRILFYDKNAELGTPPTLSQLLENASSPVYQMNSPLNENNRGRFKIISDVVFNDNMQSPHSQWKKYKKFIDMKDNHGNRTVSHKVTWTGTNGTDTDKNHIYEFIMANGGTTNMPIISGMNRITYIDN